MSKASKRNHARLIRLRQRARRVLLRSRRGRTLIAGMKAFRLEEAQNLLKAGGHIKMFDVSRVVDENLAERVRDYSPAKHSGNEMCDDLNICGGVMNGFLIETAAKLKTLRWDFTYGDEFIADAQGKTVVDLKVQVAGRTQ